MPRTLDHDHDIAAGPHSTEPTPPPVPVEELPRASGEAPTRVDPASELPAHGSLAEATTVEAGADAPRPKSSWVDRRWVRVALAVVILVGLGVGVGGAVLMSQAARISAEATDVAADAAEVEADVASLQRRVDEREGLVAEARADAQTVRDATDVVVGAADALLAAVDASASAQIAMVDLQQASTDAWNRGDSATARSIVRDEVLPAVDELRASLKASTSALRSFRAAISALQDVIA